jgi:hypothetical protein
MVVMLPGIDRWIANLTLNFSPHQLHQLHRIRNRLNHFGGSRNRFTPEPDGSHDTGGNQQCPVLLVGNGEAKSSLVR